MKRDGLGRDWYGGNSGYIGYSMSKRAAEARERGRFPKTDFRKYYDVSPKMLEFLVDNGYVSDSEWHHTSKYGNKTVFYDWTIYAKDCYYENKDELKRLLRKHDEDAMREIFDDFIVEKQTADALKYEGIRRRAKLYEEYKQNYWAARPIPEIFRTSNGLFVNTKDMSVFAEDGRRFTKRSGRGSRDNAIEEFRQFKRDLEKDMLTYSEFLEKNNLGGIMGKITKDNMSEYLDEVAKASAEFLPLYKDAIDMLEFYDEDADIKENVDMTIEHANELLEKNAPKKEEKGGKTEESGEEEETSKPKTEKKPKKASKPKAEKKPKAKKEDNAERVAAITPEKKIIGDFCKLASFSGTASALKDKVRLLLNRLQNAIVQKQIRKTSKYANEIMSIQTKLVSFLNSGATGKVKVEIDNLDELMKIAKSEKVSENVMIARAFIRLNNKSDKMKEATALLKRINKAIEADIANEEVKMLKPSLESFISKKTKAVEPSERALRGLYGLAGVEDGAAANSMQLINQHYDVMTLSGRWKDFIGRPSKNFKMMVYGKPGQGKSTFSILLARYLAKEKGLRVLYVAAEEKFGYTLQEKIKRLEALTPNLDFAEDLTISDLPNYDVVLLDSVNHLQMDADELATLPQNCAYVWIFQATKEGNYKGGQQYAHDSDIVIKVDSMKARTEKNRFGATNVEFDIEDYED